MSKKNRLIIIEGPQGTGKTTLANYLRENIPSSNLYRLSGQSDKTLEGKEKRLMRESHHNYQSFSIKNSIDQQIAYLKMGQELKNNLIKVMPIAMDDFDQAYLKINRTFSLKQK